MFLCNEFLEISICQWYQFLKTQNLFFPENQIKIWEPDLTNVGGYFVSQIFWDENISSCQKVFQSILFSQISFELLLFIWLQFTVLCDHWVKLWNLHQFFFINWVFQKILLDFSLPKTFFHFFHKFSKIIRSLPNVKTCIETISLLWYDVLWFHIEFSINIRIQRNLTFIVRFNWSFYRNIE